MIRRGLASLILVTYTASFILSPAPGFAQDPTDSPQETPAAGARLFTVKEQAQALGSDPQRIFRFVSDQIRYESYAGVLRGSEGTLLAQAGNSFDKSLLLAALLKEAGVEFRFVRGILEPGAMDRTIASMLTPQPLESSLPGESPGTDFSKLTHEQQEFLEEGYDRYAAMLERIQERTDENFKWLADLLEANGISAPQEIPDQVRPLRKELEEHLWLEAKLGEEWVAMDPSVPAAPIGQAFGKPQDYPAEIPKDLLHWINLSIWIRSGAAAGQQDKHIVSHDVPAFFLFGKSVTIANTPEAGLAGLGSMMGGMLEGKTGTTFYPAIQIGTQTYEGEAVTWAPPRPASTASKPKRGGGLFGGLDVLDEAVRPEEAAKDNAKQSLPITEWVEATLRSPGGGVEKLKWNLFHWDASSGGNPDPTAASWELSVISGKVLYPVLGRLLRRALFSASPDSAWRMSSYLNYNHAFLRDEMLDYVYEPSDAIRYVDSPHLAVTEIALQENQALSLKMNLVRPARRVLLPADAPPERWQRLFFEQLFMGVLDAQIERAVVEETVSQEEGALAWVDSVPSLFEKAKEQGIPLWVLTQASSDKVKQLSTSEAVKTRLREQLAAGNALVIPSRPVAIGSQSRLGWWRVVLATGQTQDETPEGQHQASTEKAVLETHATTTATRAMQAFQKVLCSKIATIAFVILSAVATEATMGSMGSVLQDLMEQVGNIPACPVKKPPLRPKPPAPPIRRPRQNWPRPQNQRQPPRPDIPDRRRRPEAYYPSSRSPRGH
ncbi:MAG: hypothetical protein HYS41_07175 [Candidatus Omnitrophica bacterium]|nr:hypothetical protein [Candidatus Omnitrophota bacterium]